MVEKMNSIQLIKQQEETIAQLHTVIAELNHRGLQTQTPSRLPTEFNELSTIDIQIDPPPENVLVALPENREQVQQGWMSTIWYILGY